MKTTNFYPAAALLLTVLVLNGCATSRPVADHEYLLRPPELAPAGRSVSVVRLKSVAVAPYLDQKGVVLQTGPAEIRVAKHHRWAEPLDDAIVRYLQVSIANQGAVSVEVPPLISPGRRDAVTVHIHRLHGTGSGEVRLVADWQLMPVAGEVSLYRFDRSTVQRENGYPALIEAHGELLDELAAAIAGSIALHSAAEDSAESPQEG